MIDKKPCLIIAFDSATDASAADLYCKKKGIRARLIPLPTQIAAGCGLALMAEPSEEEILPLALSHAGIAWTKARVIDF